MRRRRAPFSSRFPDPSAVDRDGATVVFTLAGHHPPIVLRATGGAEEVGALGTALALFDDPELHDTTVHLGPADLLCVFTDGLVEARREREMFGVDRVTAVLGCAAAMGFAAVVFGNAFIEAVLRRGWWD